MLDQMQTDRGIHGAVRPGEYVALQIGPMKLASGRITFRLAFDIHREEPEIGPQLGEVAQCFACGRTEIEQCAGVRGRGDKRSPGVHPGKMAEPSPCHDLSRRSVAAWTKASTQNKRHLPCSAP